MANNTLLTSINTPGYDFSNPNEWKSIQLNKRIQKYDDIDYAEEKFIPKSSVMHSIEIEKKMIRSGVGATLKIDGVNSSLGFGKVNNQDIYLAGFSDSGLYKSIDSIEWELIQGTESYSPVSICWGIKSGVGVFLISTLDDGLFEYNGINLVKINDEVIGNSPLRSICYNGFWKATGYSGIFSSMNGIKWSSDNINISGSEEPSFYDVKYADGLWYSASDCGIWKYNNLTNSWDKESILDENDQDISDSSFISIEHIPSDNLDSNLEPYWLALCDDILYSGLWKYDGTSWSKLNDEDYPGVIKIFYSHGIIILAGTDGSYCSMDFGKTFVPYVNEAYNPTIYDIPNDAVELSNDLIELSGSHIYKITNNRTNNIVVKSGADISLYIGSDVEVSSFDSHVIYIELGGKLKVYNNGIIIGRTTKGSYSIILSNGECELNGGVIAQTKPTVSGNHWYTIVNHGKLMTINNIKMEMNLGSSSCIVNGYYNNCDGNDSSLSEKNYWIKEINEEFPKMIINSGWLYSHVSTSLIKNDFGGELILNNGVYITKGWACLQNNGVSATINGGSYIQYNVNYCIGLNKRGDTDEILASHEPSNLYIYGGRFISKSNYWFCIYTEFSGDISIKGGIFDYNFNYAYKYDGQLYGRSATNLLDNVTSVRTSGSSIIIDSNESNFNHQLVHDRSNFVINNIICVDHNYLIGTSSGILVDYIGYNSYFNHAYDDQVHSIGFQLSDWKSLIDFDDSSFRIRDWEFYLDNNKLKAHKIVEEN